MQLGIVTVRPGGRTVPKRVVQWTVRRRYGSGGSLITLDGTGRIWSQRVLLMVLVIMPAPPQAPSLRRVMCRAYACESKAYLPRCIGSVLSFADPQRDQKARLHVRGNLVYRQIYPYRRDGEGGQSDGRTAKEKTRQHR
ncbi:hypothetical protein DFH08DRAFT_809283 [Mycena albidolilacea]|uniref:Uncharacterized protein n=1 Tax=Mycena albidolilacea TaxID=1033008 RepID=A0AAD7A1L3_9AGAR|nr:hypothetical protein DFH08DRAFT_809283 [Mycena albidolilacea]